MREVPGGTGSCLLVKLWSKNTWKRECWIAEKYSRAGKTCELDRACSYEFNASFISFWSKILIAFSIFLRSRSTKKDLCCIRVKVLFWFREPVALSSS
jgi:hypothetical protein